MAERRMFAKTIIDSDSFLDMPLSTQALYFHLSMRADDDGFINNPKKVQRMVGCADDDLKLLIAKNFIIPFESGIVVIKHWKIHNYIRSDRYKETVYKEEKALLEVKENKAYTLGIPDGYQMDTQDRLGKDRIGKDRIEYTSDSDEPEPPVYENGNEVSCDESPQTPQASNPVTREKVPYQEIVDMFNSLCPSYPSVRTLSDARKRAIRARMKSYSIEDFKTLFEKAEASSFLKGGSDRNWSANFDWLIKDSNMAKVLDGNYDNRQNKHANSAVQRLDDLDGIF